MAQSGDAALFFTDDDFVWVDPVLETAPTVPAVLPPRARPRRQARTFAGDLARLRSALAREAAALPPRARTLLAGGILAALLVLALLVTFRGGQPAAPGPAGPSASKPSAPPENAPPAVRILRAGDHAPAVADLQQALGALGLYSQPIDGAFGDSTGAAVLAFQRDHGLVADGIVGPTTVQALVGALSEGAKSDAAAAENALAAAAAAGRISHASADHYRSLVNAAVARLDTLPPGRVAVLALVFHAVAAIAPDYDEPRALTVFSMLKTNADYLAKHRLSVGQADIEDANGVVYRYFPEHGFQFHPIADFARLNKLAAAGKREEVRRLAAALVARGEGSGKALVWEYYFAFGGPPRWASGFAQAIAAQALARSAQLLDDPELEERAHAAYLALSQGLWRELGGGLWVREYGFSDMAILNAQLQSLVSLYEYVKISGDTAAQAGVAKLAAATKALLPQFDTGCWSRYSLGGSPASLHYHTYHVRLLKELAAGTGDPLWATTAARWDGYLRSGSPTAC